MNILLPNSAHLGNIDGTFLRYFDPTDSSTLSVSSNPKWISVHPVVLAMTAALALKVPKVGITCDAFVARSSHYLERMGLFKFLCYESGLQFTEHESAGRFVPLTQVKNSAELTAFLKEMIPLLHLQPTQAEPLRYIVSELVRNVLEHSGSADGAIVAAQYFPNSNKISIGIADTGIGIRASMGRSYPNLSDIRALHLALTPGITGTTRREGGTEQNAGAGLFFVKSIAKTNRNFMVLYSGSALYKLLRSPEESRIIMNADPKRDRHTSKQNVPYWQGTVVGIDLSLDSTPEFTSLLDSIRSTYFSAIRERRRARYRKPRFV